MDKTGLPLNERGVPLFDRRTLQCGSSTIFIAGDASNNAPLLHEAADQGRFAAGLVSFEDQGRSRVMLRNQGLLKVYGEQGSGLFLGAEMFGPAAEHIGHLLAWAAQQRMTVSSMLEMPFYHPVIEEGLRTALRDLNHKLHIGPDLIERCMDCGPGA